MRGLSLILLLALICAINSTASQSVPAAERAALVDFFFAMDGPSWANNHLWNTDASPCTWHGITCLHNNPSHVFGLNLMHNRLNGTIPASIIQLTELYNLNLAGNTIYGDVPLFLGNLTALQSIDVSYNRLSGELPQDMFLWLSPHLQVFNASGNLLIGPIPTTLQLVPQVALFDMNFGCQYDAWMYRFVSMCTQDQEYIRVLFRLIGWVLFTCVIMTVICVVAVKVTPKTTLLTDPAIPEYTPDQLTDLFFERSKKKKKKTLKTGSRRDERFTLPNLEHPVPAVSTFQLPTANDTALRPYTNSLASIDPSVSGRSDSVHYVGFAEFGLRP